MEKLNVAVIFGGHSSEYNVSLESASAVIRNLDTEKYHPVPVGITKEGDWFYFKGDAAAVSGNTWYNKADCIPAALSPNRSEHCLLLFEEGGVKKIPVDVVFPVLHGRNGEDGTVQGAVEMAGIPLAGCGVLASALCMDKDRAHRLAAAAGIRVPRAAVIKSGAAYASDYDGADAFADEIGYPLYVKPVKAGSSFGVTRVTAHDQLHNAIVLAFEYDDQVILEENIDGFEVGCAVLGRDQLITGEIDEIELSGGFFNFTEKYTLKTSAIHVPARIDAQKSEEIKKTAVTLYKALGCSGFARVDMFLTPEGEIVFNEINTIPGFTEHSRYPGMMKAAGHTFGWIIDQILQQAVKDY